MYSFLESISEILDRFGLVILGGLIGSALLVYLLGGKVAKPKQAQRKLIKPIKISPRIRLSLIIIGLGLVWGGEYLSKILGINKWVFFAAGAPLFSYNLWRL